MGYYEEQGLAYPYDYAQGGNPIDADEPTWEDGWRSAETRSLQGMKDNPPENYYAAMLEQIGIPMSPFFKQLIDTATTESWSDDELWTRLEKSNHFKKIFPGYFRPDGSKKFDNPAQYREAEDTYKSTAREMGIRIGNIHTAKLIANDVSADEFADRMQAIDRMRDYEPAMKNFLAFTGWNGNPEFAGKGGMFDFVLGLSPKKFYQAYEQMSMANAAERAGVDFLDKKDIKKWTGFTDGNMTEDEYHQRMVEVAKKRVKELPISQLHGFGLNKSDLVELEMGGPNAGKIARTIERGMKTEEAAWHRQDFSQKVSVTRPNERKQEGM